MCVYCVYLLCIYKYTHMHEYIKKKNVYILNIFIYNINTCKYFQSIYCMCVSVYIHNNIHSTHTYII